MTKQLPVATDITGVRTAIAAARSRGLRIGAVPTMGALHAGHTSLIEIARQECEYVVATIFVNPTQFGPNEDFDKYPRTFDADLDACQAAGADLVFHPSQDVMYRDDAATTVAVRGLSTSFEGASRPAHFDGVTTVVLKLFHILLPDVAYFGQKDYQQQVIIRNMCRDLDVGVEIVTCPIVREPDGLAMSSRNRFLSADERQSALALSQALKIATDAADRNRREETDLDAIESAMADHLRSMPGIDPDYAVIVDADTLANRTDGTTRLVALVAARVGTTRLIDNAILTFA